MTYYESKEEEDKAALLTGRNLDRLLQHERYLLPMRRLPPRSGRKADIPLALLLNGNVPFVSVLVVLDILGIPIDRRLTARRGVGGEEGIEPGEEGSHLCWRVGRGALEYKGRVEVELGNGHSVGINVLRSDPTA